LRIGPFTASRLGTGGTVWTVLRIVMKPFADIICELAPRSAASITSAEAMTDLSDYDYDLPRELIAQYPLENRADARLLLVDRARRRCRHHFVRDLPELLLPGDCLVLNDTRVVPARLIGFRTQTGGRWEGLFLSAEPDGAWRLLCKTRGKLAAGESITLLDNEGRDEIRLALLEKREGGTWLAQPLIETETFALLDRVGRVPLPPYIRGGEMRPSDAQRYQTVYAARPGSVAAPTAGLHFTAALLERLLERGVRLARVTLHVGLGTFRPIEAERIEDHVMHGEWGEISSEAVAVIDSARGVGGRVIAVGTTAVRVLETAGASGPLVPWRGETNLFVRPGHEFRVIDGLMTNFHLPRSTLLVLVRTFGGEELIRAAYEEAIRERYRFYSYGDAALIV
jgi:S-adenosylmethionine:tRNA ribosyltransferase-isomerase